MVDKAFWDNCMKRIRLNGLRRDRAWRLFMDSTHTLARLAHPATGGMESLCRNWGNAESNRIWRKGWNRWQAIARVYDKRYNAIMREMRGLPALEDIAQEIAADNRQITRAMESVA